MKILINAIVSNSEMIKNYKGCREKAESLGKIYILKNNQPDAVLLSIAEYERLSAVIEHIESLGDKELAQFVRTLSQDGDRNKKTISDLKIETRAEQSGP
jgi:prevent-host-death family protein